MNRNMDGLSKIVEETEQHTAVQILIALVFAA